MRLRGQCDALGFLTALPRRAVTCLLITGQAAWAIPVHAQDVSSGEPRNAAQTQRSRINRTAPDVEPPSLTVSFSDSPSDDEFLRTRVLEEPLAPTTGPYEAAENKALANALLAFANRGESESAAALTGFLAQFPRSRWRASILLNLGLFYRWTGYLSRALDAWEEAWALAKDEKGANIRALADRSIAELAALNARLGRADRLTQIFSAELVGRSVGGPAAETLAGAREGLGLMTDSPDRAFLCGPFAVGRILALHKPAEELHAAIRAARSTPDGTSFEQVLNLAREVGLHYQVARRMPGAEIILPAVVHWKVGHFAAIVREEGGRYLVKDPTFRHDYWISSAAIDEEASGYFMVPDRQLPTGWQAARSEETAGVWGKGHVFFNDKNATRCIDRRVGGCNGQNCGSKGMAVYSFHAHVLSLHITDTPVAYRPPVGPPVNFRIVFNQREANQPSIFTYSNLGPRWTTDWISYVVDDPTNPAFPPAVYVRSGGTDAYPEWTPGSNNTQTAPQRESQAKLVRVTTTEPPTFERFLPDGSKEVFEVSDGASTYPRKTFLTQIVDPAGNIVTLGYDANRRLVALTDAIGQVTTLAYGLANDSLKITGVTDPFGRTAKIEYTTPTADAPLRPSRITDVLGIVSAFEYDDEDREDFVTSLTTPYGVTRFATRWPNPPGQLGLLNEWVEAVDPMGGTERIEFIHHAEVLTPDDPTTIPGFTVTDPHFAFGETFYYWDKRAMSEAPARGPNADFPYEDTPSFYAKAFSMRWAYEIDNANNIAAMPVSEKKPHENRVWYAYPGGFQYTTGTIDEPNFVARVVWPEGYSNNWEHHGYTYTGFGKAASHREAYDKIGQYTQYRETRYSYDPAGIDLVRIERENAGVYEVLASYTYNTQHQPLTVTDAAGQTTTFTYNARGQVMTVTTPPRGGIPENRTTSFSYNPDGYLQTITGPASEMTVFTYDGFGRVRTVTDSDSYTVSYDYDALDRVIRIGYPDSTFEQIVYDKLDVGARRDRLGRWTNTYHDALRRVVAVRDPIGRTTSYQWCTCGDLEKIIDPNGHATSWVRDLQGRVTREVRSDGKSTSFSYEATSGRLKSRTDAKGQGVSYAYMNDGNVKTVTYANAQIPTPNLSFTYDAGYGRVVNMTDGTGTTAYTYHPINPPSLGAGRLASVDGPLPSDTVSYTYDELGRIRNRGTTGGTTTLSYDALGRVTGVATPLGPFSLTYDAATSRPLTLGYPNSQTTQYSYFPNSGDRHLQQIQHLAPGGGLLSRFSYGYDTVGNIKTWTQEVGAPAQNHEIAYDLADQIGATTVKGTGNPPSILKRYAWAYDRAGNRVSEQVDDNVVTSLFNARNQLTSQQAGGSLLFKGTVDEWASMTVQGKAVPVAPDNSFASQAQVVPGTNNVVITATDSSGNLRTNTYQVTVTGSNQSMSYDANGNLASRTEGANTWLYSWDAENRLTRLQKNGVDQASFVYDGLGRRQQKIAGGVTHTFVHDGDHVLEDRLSTGGTIRSFHGGGIDDWLGRQETTGAATFFTADHLGSIAQHTNSAGQVTLTRRYDPWGNLDAAGALQPGPAFTGREWDPETSLYYYRAKYYDPKIGRFLGEDPIGPLEAPNPYTYVGGNPVNRIDPMGDDWLDSTLYYGAQFSAGFGDNLTFDITGQIREAMGTNDVIDECNGVYSAGQWSGVALSTAGGLAAGLKVAGSKAAGLEFSHYIPDRFLKQTGSNWIRNKFGRSPLNGNYVTPARHFKHDPFRYPSGWRDLGPRFNPVAQQLDRVPRAVAGTAAGMAYGGASMARNQCACN